VPDRPTLAAAWALIWQPDHKRSTIKTDEGCPRPKKKSKKSKKREFEGPIFDLQGLQHTSPSTEKSKIKKKEKRDWKKEKSKRQSNKKNKNYKKTKLNLVD